jgi:hypothetical protein
LIAATPPLASICGMLLIVSAASGRHHTEHDQLRLVFLESVAIDVSRRGAAANDLIGMALHQRYHPLAEERARLYDDSRSEIARRNS